jgi:uncharacterized protein
MKNISICRTKNDNYYLVSYSGPYHIFLHPLLLHFIKKESQADQIYCPLPEKLVISNHEYNNEEIKYYYDKYKFLKRHKLLDNRPSPKSVKMGSLNEDDIKIQLANLTDLVFEVTEACNLNCRYCCNGEFYDNHDLRYNNVMSFETAKTIIDYLITLWGSSLNHSLMKNVTFGFYGGEPLLNFKLIKNIIEYIESTAPSSLNYKFNMTTNGMLLHRYMDYLVLKNISVLISLDGDEMNNCYRLTKTGVNSFSQVYKNVQLFRDKYPDFFKLNVNINAVLHNKNSLREIFTFINNKFNKNPYISTLNISEINPKKCDEFNQIYKNVREETDHINECDELYSKIELTYPELRNASLYVMHNSGSFFRTYSDLFYYPSKSSILPTGTCIPFSRKMFVTVTGKILPCERIGFRFSLGSVVRNTVEINFQNIALMYTEFYLKLKNQCTRCQGNLLCTECIFHIKNIQEKPICTHSSNSKQFDIFVSSIISFFEKHPEAYKKSMDMMIS